MEADEQRVLEIARTLALELHPERRGRLPGTNGTLDGDFGFDSLSRVELLRRIEDDLGVSIKESTLFEAERLSDLVSALGSLRRRQTSTPSARTVKLEEVSEPVEAETLIDCLEWHAVAHPDRPHIYLETEERLALNYGELWRSAKEFAGGLQARGVQAGDPVGLMLPTSATYFPAFYGILLAGAVPVPLYPPLRLDQIEDHLRRQASILENCEAHFLILSRELLHKARGLGFALRAEAPKLKVLALEDIEALPPLPVPRRADDVALIQYTSGSTGNPKGVTLTHRNLLANIRAMGRRIQGGPKDIFVSWLPLYHDMGLIGAWLGSLYYAAPLVLLTPFSFLADPARWLWTIHRYRATLTSAPNFAYELCLKRIRDEEIRGLDLSSLRFCFNGAEPVSVHTVRRFLERFRRFGLKDEALSPVYGLAEASVGLTFPPAPRPPLIDVIDRAAFQRTGRAEPTVSEDALEIVACGQPLPGHEVRVVDSSGRELPEREEGRIQFRGPSATAGYWRSPEKNAELIEDGWLNTGDLGYVARSDLFVTGRSKDVVIHAGRKLQPHELEEAVGSVVGIRRGCVVAFGSPDPRTGTERLVIVAETKETSPDALDRLRAAMGDAAARVAGSAPDDIVLAPPHTVLKTSSGKIRRAASREAYERGTLKPSAVPAWLQLGAIVVAGIVPALHRAFARVQSRAYSLFALLTLGLFFPPLWLLVMTARPERARRVVKSGARLLARLLGIPIELKGHLDLLADGKRRILVANHSSYVDAFVLTAALPAGFTFVAKTELRRFRFLRAFMNKLGTEYVERFERKQSLEDARRIAQLAREGKSFLFFPEGTFTRQAGLLPFHLGAFLAASEAEIGVVPIAVTGTRDVLGAETWWPRRGKISIEICQEIAPAPGRNAWEKATRLSALTRDRLLRANAGPDLGLEKVPA